MARRRASTVSTSDPDVRRPVRTVKGRSRAIAAALALTLAASAQAQDAPDVDAQAFLTSVQAARARLLGTPSDRSTPGEIQAALEPGETLLVFGALPTPPTRIAVLAVTGDEITHPRVLGRTPEQLAGAVREVYRLLGSGSRPARGQLLRLTDDLGDELLGPVAEILAASTRVVIHADPVLDDLPFATLRVPRSVDRRRGHLVEHAAVCHLSELGDLGRGAAFDPQGTLVALVDPEFRLTSRPLGASMSDAGVSWRRSAARRQEAQALESAFDHTAMLVGTEAGRAALRARSPVRLLHLGANVVEGHALSVATLELSAGDASARPDLLPLRELPELVQGESALLVLSGLQPDRSGREAGEENARNFLTPAASAESALGTPTELAARMAPAGFDQALLTLWLAPDDASPILFGHVYAALAEGASAAEALRHGQLELISGPIDVGGAVRLDAREPLYWAGFRLYSSCS